jgi:hypothetical protein
MYVYHKFLVISTFCEDIFVHFRVGVNSSEVAEVDPSRYKGHTIKLKVFGPKHTGFTPAHSMYGYRTWNVQA